MHFVKFVHSDYSILSLSIKTEYGVKSSMAASDTNSPTIFFYIIVFYQYEMNRYVCDILLSLRLQFGKNVKYLQKCIFYLRDNQTLGICAIKTSILHISVIIVWQREYHSQFCQMVEIDNKCCLYCVLGNICLSKTSTNY